MATNTKVLGTVTSTVGEVRATASDGTVRILQVGDKVFSDEVISTSANGDVKIALEGAGGRTLECGNDTTLALTEGMLGIGTAVAAQTSPVVAPSVAATQEAATPPAGKPPAGPTDVAALQAAIAAGADPSQVAEATAAGGAPGAGGGDGGGGHQPVIIEQGNSSGVVTSGFNTQGGSIQFPTPEFELNPIEEGPPVVSVSVSVQVEVDVEDPQDPTGGVIVSGNAASLIEGTNGEQGKLVNFIISLDKVFDVDVQVTYTIVPVTAANPEDFFDGPLSQTVTILAGQTEIIVPVIIVQDHFVESDETFNIVLSDPVNATINPAADTAFVTIVDDDALPVANADTNWVQEDSALVAEGNVIESTSHSGAPSGSFSDAADTDDEPLTVTNPGTYVGTYGTLVLSANGDYTYTLNNSHADVQALDDGQTLADSFSYSVTDGFNTPSSSTLTISIFGTNDGPEIVVRIGNEGPFASSAEGTVNEAALAIGSDPESDAEFVSGSFQVSDPNGLGDIDSVTINGKTVAIGSLAGESFNGSAGVLTITSYDGGIANFTYELKQPVTDGAGDETDVFTLTTFDGEDTSAEAKITIKIIDDLPGVDVSATAGADALVVDESVLGTNATANFADNFSTSSTFGADGAGTLSTSFSLGISASGADSGLNDVATGQDVLLFLESGQVVGRAGSAAGAVVFTVSVNGSGVVTLDQVRAVSHPNASDPDDPVTLSASNLITLTRSASITDLDGDAANDSATIGIGTALTFEDDGPSINTTGEVGSLVVDETFITTDTDSADFAGAFTFVPGVDGASVSYKLGIGGANGLDSGLDDSATGQNIVLVLNGSVVEGRVGTTSGDVAFTLTLSGSTVTLDQMRAVKHGSADADVDANEPVSLNSAANLVTLTAVVTDADGDKDEASIDLGKQVSFLDDGPSVSVAPAVADDSPTTDTVAEDGAAITGTWTRNAGADGATIQVTSGASTQTLSDTDLVTFTTSQGTLTVYGQNYADSSLAGKWTFDPNPDLAQPQSVNFTVKITDADGDTDEDSHTVNITDGADPSGGGVVSLSVDENLITDTDNTDNALTFNAGSDALTSFAFSTDLSGLAVNTDEIAGADVVWTRVSDTVIEGRVGGDLAITLTLSAPASILAGTSGQVTVTATLSDAFKHVDGGGTTGVNLGSVQVVAKQTDGDSATGTVNVAVIDDVPDAFIPEGAAIKNAAAQSEDYGLDFAPHVGADGVKGVEFTTAITSGVTLATDAHGNLLTLNDQQLFLHYGSGGSDKTIIEAKTAGGVTGFTITLDPDSDSYTVTVNGVISNGTEIDITDLSSVGGGNNDFKALNVGTKQNPDPDGTDDVLASTTPGKTINTNNNNIGVGTGQSFTTGDKARFDFVDNLTEDSTNVTGFKYDNHNLVSEFSQEIDFVLGGGNNKANLTLRAVLADDDSAFIGDSNGEETVPLTAANIKVFDRDPDSVGAIDKTSVVTITPNNDGSVTIAGMLEGWWYVISSTKLFSAVEVTGANGTDTFKLGAMSFDIVNDTGAIELSYGVVGTDTDGDSINSEINVSLYPSNGTIAGTDINDNLSGTSGNDFILGQGGDDILVGGGGNDVLVGGSGSDTLTGGSGSDTFKFTDHSSADSITSGDFTVGNLNPANGMLNANADVLDLHDVLPQAAQGQTTEGALMAYLTVTPDGSGNTVISVDIDGSGGGATMPVVTLQGVTVTLADLLTNNQIIT